MLGLKRLRAFYDNSVQREEFVKSELSNLTTGLNILDAGCGDQKYRQYCAHLNYKAQDFGKYTVDSKLMIGSEGLGGSLGYQYGELDFIGNIWEIEEQDNAFDAILCTEVLEHVPYAVETLAELTRLLKPGGVLILTAPSNCLRHMDPFFYSSGYSDRFYEFHLEGMGLKIESMQAIGHYYRWISVEILRTIRLHKVSALFLMPALAYFSIKKRTEVAVDTLCMGYHIKARKIDS